MSMVTTKAGASMSDINMTPMIDVLLVLLVIFMIALPSVQQIMNVQVPVTKNATTGQQSSIVLDIASNGQMTINTQPVSAQGLRARLVQIYSNRPDKLMFVKAAGNVSYGEVIHVMDVARGAGVEVLGAVLPAE